MYEHHKFLPKLFDFTIFIVTLVFQTLMVVKCPVGICPTIESIEKLVTSLSMVEFLYLHHRQTSLVVCL